MKAALAQWSRASGCRLAVLFGSDGTNDGGSQASDVDIALSFSELPRPERRLNMIGELVDICGGQRVDVVFLRPETNPILRFEIFRGGVPLHESRPGIFVVEAVRALIAYEDALPFRRALRQSLRQTAAPS